MQKRKRTTRLTKRRSSLFPAVLAGILHRHSCQAFSVQSRTNSYHPLVVGQQPCRSSSDYHSCPIRRHRRLTTKVNGDEDSKRLSLADHFRKAGAKFRARPGTYMIIPCVAALVGWFTNWLAVQMIFYPIRFRGIPLWIKDEVPLGFLGWQGIVPCKTRPMSEAMVHMVTSQLLTVKEAFARLDPSELAKRLAPEVPKLGESVLADIVPQQLVGLPKAAFFGLPAVSQRILQHFNFAFLRSLCQDMISNVDNYFNIQNCVQNQMLQDRSLLGELFKKCGQKELDFLTNSGLWFGFLLGLIQMAVALFFENPWTLSIGGLIVGLATNWLALKWIFEPVNPTRVGPFILQGQFLRRQKEVAAEFSKFFANRILTSHQVWNSILTDPTTSPSFYALFARHFMGFANRVTGCLRINVEPEVIQMATNRAMTKLPEHIPVLHSYIDRTLGLEGTLRVKMEQMTSSQFERVLHPIFEEDEATLIAAGAVLGFAAGLIQQGLETGKIKLPDFWSPVAKKIGPYLEYPRSQLAVFGNKAKASIRTLATKVRATTTQSWRSLNGSSANGVKSPGSSSSKSTTANQDIGDSSNDASNNGDNAERTDEDQDGSEDEQKK
ncbi:expressed unknown protein [Seminavis robusta]|uniref:Uncharacterized protein n=1 Tax=Seminavis robusta TaxID=568900 RepID=A0A9N8HEN0_9STRA|nr:expressed unknown protein [Seminavis robusta]|eukprot:Sro482_g151760.1 n/a (608) ;mRNA; r:10688-12851